MARGRSDTRVFLKLVPGRRSRQWILEDWAPLMRDRRPRLSMHNNIFSIDENVSWIKGKHTIKGGFNYIKMQTNDFSNSLSVRLSDLQCGNNCACRIPDISAMDALQAGPVSGIWSCRLPFRVKYQGDNGCLCRHRRRRIEWDDMQVTCKTISRPLPKLTFNMGLRYDLFLPQVRAHNQMSWFDPQVTNPDLGIKGALVFATPERRAGSTKYTQEFRSPFRACL